MMSDNPNFFEVHSLWGDDEPSLFRLTDDSNLIELESYGLDLPGCLNLQKNQSILSVELFLVLDHEPTEGKGLDASEPIPLAEAQLLVNVPKKTDFGVMPKKRNKTKKIQSSPFHNYQKHLNNALKTLIIVPQFNGEDHYKQAAWKIWNAYCAIEIKTKRVLHFIFNQQNQHFINEPELKTYGLLDIYRQYGEEVVGKAKNFLSKLAIDQIDQANLQGYLKTRKIKKVDGLKDYILSFRHELETGYLKRRINPEFTL